MLNTDIAKQAEIYKKQLIDKLSSDYEFIEAAEKLAELELKNNNLDHLGHILKLRPKAGFIGNVIDGITGYFGNYEKQIDEHRVFLASILGSTIEQLQPDFNAMSAKEAIAYEYFLTTLKTNYWNITNDSQLNRFKEQAHLIALSKGNDETAKEIIALQEAQEFTQEGVNLIAKANLELVRGRKQFQQIIETIKNNTTDEIEQQTEQNSQVSGTSENLAALGIDCNTDLQNLVQSSAVVRTQIKSIHDYLKEQDKQQAVKANFQGVMDTFGFIGELGKYVGNEDLCRLAVIGQATAQIAFASKLLAGMASFGPASLTPMTAIGTAVLSIIGALGRKPEDPNKIVLAAIRSIATQLHQMRIEMHERFDRIDLILGKTYSLLIYSFCELRLDHFTIKSLLENIRHEMQSGHRDIKDSLNTLSHRLQTIANRQLLAERKNKIGKVYENINKITGPHQLDAYEFKDLFNSLKTEVCNLLPNDIFLIGESSGQANIVKSFEEDAMNPFFSDFNIAPLYRHVHAVMNNNAQDTAFVNPLVWCWEVMGMMVLAQRRYEKSENPESYISKAEIDELRKIMQIGIETKSFISSLNNPMLLESLQANYQQAGAKLKQELGKYIAEQEQEITMKLNQNWQKNIDAFSDSPVELFKTQDIPIATDRHANWFKCYSTNHHPNFLKMFAHGYDGPYWGANTYGEQEKLKYSQARKNEIGAFKGNYINGVRNPLLQAGQGTRPLQNNHFNLFSDPQAENNPYHAFIFPEVDGQPILPMPTHYRQRIPQAILNAEWLGVGRIKFGYRIENGQFILETKFITKDQTHLIGSLHTPYQPEIFAGNEAIWCFWVGGHYNSNGAISDVTVHSYQTPETNVWKNNVYIPVCTYHTGRRDLISYDSNNVLQYAEERIYFNDNDVPLEIKNKIIEVRHAYGKDVAREIKEKLGRDDTSDFAKTTIEFSYQFYMLQSALFLLFRDHENFKSSVLKYFYNEENKMQTEDNQAIKLLRNRADLLSILESYQGGDTHFSNLLESNLEFFNRNVIQAISKLISASDRLNYDLFEMTLNEFSNLINWYDQHAVDENSLVTSMSNEKLLQEQNDLQQKLLRAVGSAVVAVTNPDQQRDILSLIRKNLQQQSIELPVAMANMLLLDERRPDINATVSVRDLSMFSSPKTTTKVDDQITTHENSLV